MDAEKFAISWGDYASQNDIVMVFPQAMGCWNEKETDPAAHPYNKLIASRDAEQLIFFKHIVERVKQQKKNIPSHSRYEWGTAYGPHEFYVDLIPGMKFTFDCKSHVLENGKMGGDCNYLRHNEDGTT